MRVFACTEVWLYEKSSDVAADFAASIFRAPKTFVAAVHSVMGIVCGECKRALVQVQPECCPDEIRVALCNAKLEWLHFASHTM